MDFQPREISEDLGTLLTWEDFLGSGEPFWALPTCRVPFQARVGRNRLKRDLVWPGEKPWFRLQMDISTKRSFRGPLLGHSEAWLCCSGAEWVLRRNTCLFKPRAGLFRDDEQEGRLTALPRETFSDWTSFPRSVAATFFTFTFLSCFQGSISRSPERCLRVFSPWGCCRQVLRSQAASCHRLSGLP